MIRRLCVLLLWASALRTIGPTPSLGDEPSRPKEKDGPPVYVLVEKADDLDALRKKLANPDFVILTGPLYEALKSASRPSESPKRGVVESIAVSGEVLDDLAHVTVEFGLSVSGADAAWVPIRLDGQILASAREGDRDLPIRAAEGGWQVEVRGEGRHRVRVELSSPVLTARGGLEGRRLQWAIPEAASTRVQIVLSPNAADVAADGPGGKRDLLAVEPIEGAQRMRASAYVTARKSLEVSWKIATDPSSAGPPLVTARGEIELDVERGSLRARSSWEVRTDRGSLRRLDLRIDAADELVGLELDGRPVASDEPRDPTSGAIAIPLASPLKPGGSALLTVSTRRPVSPETTTRTAYRGVTILNVASQEGVVAIRQEGTDPWVTASPGRGLRAIDPRTELPYALRARPSIVLAYGFVEGAFDLGLQIDPSPPTVAVESRTTVAIAPNRARVDCWLDYTVSRGRVFEVRVAIPEGLAIEAVGPEATVAAYETLPGTSRARDALVVRLAPRASEEGKFSVHLSGRQGLGRSGPAAIGLPRPTESRARGGLVAVVSERNVSVEPAPGSPGEFAPAGGEPPAAWPWPTGMSAVKAPTLWLRHEDAPGSLPLVLATRERELREESALDVRVGRGRVDVRQDTALRVRFGALTWIDVAVPKTLDGHWEIDDAEVARREPLGSGPGGTIRYRLVLAREVLDLARLRFRIRLPLSPPLAADRPTRLEVPRLELLGATASAPRVRVGGDPGIDLEGQGAGWIIPEGNDDRSPATPRLEYTGADRPTLLATAHTRADLPRVVASRLALRSARDADGGLRTAAAYRLETHDGTLTVALPTGAEWVRARIGADSAADVERLAEGAGAYRLRLPAEAAGAVTVTLEYLQPAATPASNWSPPRLLDGGAVEETTWEVRLPASLALAGVPAGWSDENRWAWSGYVFMRQPASPGDAPMRGGEHAYAFGRVGGPSDLSPWIVSRAWLVGTCSGSVLVIGLAAMSARASLRKAWLLLPILALAVATLAPPSLIPLVLQSSALGFVLLAAAAAMQAVLERRRPGVIPASERGGVPVASPSSRSDWARSAEVGSEDSTIIRRPGTTVDHPAATAPAPAPDPEGVGSPT